MGSVTCLTTDTCLAADPGVAGSIPTRYHAFVEIDHKIISMAILLPSADLRRVVIKYVQEVLVNLPRKKVLLGELHGHTCSC